jgi:hypothetical protein
VRIVNPNIQEVQKNTSLAIFFQNLTNHRRNKGAGPFKAKITRVRSPCLPCAGPSVPDGIQAPVVAFPSKDASGRLSVLEWKDSEVHIVRNCYGIRRYFSETWIYLPSQGTATRANMAFSKTAFLEVTLVPLSNCDSLISSDLLIYHNLGNHLAC